jgi:acetyltransferase-like isoleucine patch superfamily enzyme
MEAFRVGFTNPWKIWNTLERLLWLPLARLSFAWSGVNWGENWRIFGVPIIQRHRQSTIVIGNKVDLRSTVRSNPLGPTHPVILSTRRRGAMLIIGDSFGITGGSIVAEERIEIGNNVLIGANCIIVDTDFHPLNPQKRLTDPLDGATAPVTIKDNVFIGMNSIILKGVTLHEGCVIGAGSIVTRDVPAGVIAAGNPARVVKPVE